MVFFGWIILITQFFLHKKKDTGTKLSKIWEEKICWGKIYQYPRRLSEFRKKRYINGKNILGLTKKSEWVSGNEMFFQKKIYDTFTPRDFFTMFFLSWHHRIVVPLGNSDHIDNKSEAPWVLSFVSYIAQVRQTLNRIYTHES